MTGQPSDEEILELLYKYNPWWENKAIQTEKIERSDFFKAKDRIQDREILAIIGPRRVGKTILLQQLIRELLNSNNKNILFFSVDHPAIQLTKDLNIIFRIYVTNVLRTSFNQLTEMVYIFLDEIQSLSNWESQLKSVYDFNYKIKFIVTGSSSMKIIEGGSEALVGRIHPQIMLPIKFRDFLKFKLQHIQDISERLRLSSKAMREALSTSLKSNKKELFHQQVSEEYMNLTPHKEEILTQLNNYLLYGGYPQVVFDTNRRKTKENLEDYVSLTVLRDIRRIFKVRNTDALMNLFYVLSRTSPNIINKDQLCTILGIDLNTLKTYIHALKSTFLITEADFYSNNTYRSIRKDKKLYIIDIGLRNLYANSLDEQIFTQPDKVGNIVEIVVAMHTNRLIFNLEGIKNNRIYYWRESSQGFEVDTVVTPFSKVLPIEVKYQVSIVNSDLNGLRSFASRFNSGFSLLVTKDDIGIQDSIVKIPAWLYLIMC